MPGSVASPQTLIAALRGAIILVGGLVWWVGLRRRHTLRLPTWWITGIHFSYLAFSAVFGWFLGSLGASLVMNYGFPHAAKDEEMLMVVVGTFSEVGVIVGIIACSLCLKNFALREVDPLVAPSDCGSSYSLGKALLAGLLAYLAALPTVMLVALGWQAILDYLHIPRPLQDSVALFGETHDPWKLGLLGLAAVIVAPIAEELVFRAGLFRFLRTRAPRVFAFLIPAILFGAAHANLNAFLPLVVLAIILSLAYERTGRIATSMLAHALFNLTSIALILFKLDL